MCRWTFLLMLVPGFLASAQDETRQIFDTHFANSRLSTAPNAPRVTPTYRPVAQPAPAKAGTAALRKPAHADSSDAALGITIWKMLPSVVGDPARLLVLEPNNGPTLELAPHRIDAYDIMVSED